MSSEYKLTENLSNARLLDLMHVLREEKNSQNMLNVLTEAAVCKFIVPLETSEDRISFQAVGDKNGRKFMVVFSDTDSFEINKSKEEQQAIISPFEDLLEAVTAPNLGLDGLIINPGAEEILFGRELMESIKKQMNTEVSLQIGDPDEYPAKLKQMALAFCQDEPSVRRLFARFYKAQNSNNQGWFFILDIDGDESKRTYVTDTFNRYIKPYAGTEEIITADITQDWASEAAQGGTPLYEKQ